MSDKPSEEQPSQPSTPELPDDVWEQFARDSERDIRGSAPKEPSARARMVTERLRQQEARGQLPEGWRTGPAWREMDGRAARRRRLWSIVGVVLAIAVAVVAVKPSLVPGLGTESPDAPAASPLPAETAAPTAPPGAADPEVPTLDRPFAGSPAERWADGEAGIVLPKAKAVGAYSEAQVEQALQQTRRLLVDANLAPATLRGERPKAALGVIEPHQKELLTLLDTSLRKPDGKHDPLGLFSRFDPDDVRLAGDVVKTRGRMTVEAGKQASVVVHADYTFVYPVVQVEGPPEVTRTIVRRVLDIELFDPARYRVTPGKITVTLYDVEIGNSACDVYDGYLHPQFNSAEPTGAPPSGPTTDPYDRSRGIDSDGPEECRSVSRV
ncbi:hypothetical protein [Streptomyces dysideae]|uniref:Uncharacterized protein n=1 Tax=Streptomyces dysideae TaxID=909626 RepID=A0A101V207_9ACTN|nr:hypothetical protein [Streptomyces dysideae]KUO21055.1 hypothetical protein AQJ91_10440 [Streptomyces dysideae]